MKGQQERMTKKWEKRKQETKDLEAFVQKKIIIHETQEVIDNRTKWVTFTYLNKTNEQRNKIFQQSEYKNSVQN